MQGVAISSYQGGHVEYFEYLVDRLPRGGAAATSRCTAVAAASSSPTRSPSCTPPASSRIFSPDDGQRLGLAGMVNTMIAECDVDLLADAPTGIDAAARRATGGPGPGRSRCSRPAPRPTTGAPSCERRAGRRPSPVLGITGTGGSGKSSLTDELVRRLPPRPGGQAAHRGPRRRPDPAPRRRRAARRPHPDERHRARRRSTSARWRPVGAAPRCPTCLADVIAACQAAGVDLVIVETPGHRPGRRRHRPISSTSRST